jgi:SnoaL-like protein
MKNSIEKKFLTSILFGLIILGASCEQDINKTSSTTENSETVLEKTKWTTEQEEVKATVESFLVVAGNYDLDAMADMISEKANLGISRFKNGIWETSTITITEYFEDAKNRKLRPYFEPVSKWVIHINEGKLAFVWADAILHVKGIPMTHNIDFFTLINENGFWKFLNLSFTVNPLSEDKKRFDLEIFAKSYAQAWSGKRPRFVALYFAEDGSLQVNDQKPAKGRDEISNVAKGFMTDLPDMHVRYDSLVTKSNGIEFHWTLLATNSGPSGTGKKVRVSGYEFWQISKEGLISKSQGHFPTEEYNRQLEFGVDN